MSEPGVGAAGRVEITIPTDGGGFSALELQYLLSWWRGLYVEAVHQQALLGIPWMEHNLGASQLIADRMGYLIERPRFIAENEPDYFAQDAGFEEIENPAYDLSIFDLGRRNPIELLVGGILIPLAAAVIFSGGKLEVKDTFKVQLPPIGHGIRELRKALAPLSPPRPRHGRTPFRPR